MEKTLNLPSINSTSFLLMDNPSPVPPAICMPPAACRKGSNIFSSSSAAMPIPESSTSIFKVESL
jgi:hypothetical protein